MLGIVNLKRDKLHQGVIILQAAAALAVWTILSVAIVMIFIMVTFEPLRRYAVSTIRVTQWIGSHSRRALRLCRSTLR